MLISVSKSTRALTGIKLNQLGFYNGQDELILALDEKGPISVSKLAADLSVRPSTVSKMLDRVTAAGYVERTLDKRDARRTIVKITPAGLDARSRLLLMREKLEKELISSFPGDVEAAIQALEEVAGTLRTRLLRLR
ncbi:hypothetical protein ASG43_01825 [Aureimonas sp. Leaf454]|uniref:MarR family winged helix-turn-helix transcriptional regulator n=1 Tax=Aureimonas sp. Leaf454 TaxID=1736381 RepID=UPI0007128463|nr:MarR family transcriptional regulator [Aureimonas sp. Leaf454]KQT54372.1 hypothetical protein ASG43_01825 [Aureimonas sp. Leaf454]